MYEKMIAITNRRLCRDQSGSFEPGSLSFKAYLEQIDYIASLEPAAIVLREKDLEAGIYASLAAEVFQICRRHGVELIMHTFADTARAIGCRKIHLPLPFLRVSGSISGFETAGTSVHTVNEAMEALQLGAGYLFAGNIYETDCKKGLPGKGLSFLHQICTCAMKFSERPVPVYAIGGITPEHMPQLLEAGAAGGCMMSGVMRLQPENMAQPENMTQPQENMAQPENLRLPAETTA